MLPKTGRLRYPEPMHSSQMRWHTSIIPALLRQGGRQRQELMDQLSWNTRHGRNKMASDSTRWKKKIDSQRLFSDLHTHMHMRTYTPHTHTQF